LGRNNKSDSGVERIRRRVEALVKETPSHKEIIEFFKDVVTEQYAIRSKVMTAPIEIDEEDMKLKIKEGFPLVEKNALTLDVPSATRLFKRLCKILSRNKKATQDVERITQALHNNEIDLLELFKQAVSDNVEFITSLSVRLRVRKDVLLFIAKESVKPILEAYANDLKGRVDQEGWWRGYCPVCGSEPFMAELREDGDRFLICSACGSEWRFKRLQCPFCEHEEPEGFRYFYAANEGEAYRVDVCEHCKRYIKTIDTKELGEDIIPLIEDAATLYLDMLAQNEGYTKEGGASGLAANAEETACHAAFISASTENNKICN
jgi:FdhE protein